MKCGRWQYSHGVWAILAIALLPGCPGLLPPATRPYASPSAGQLHDHLAARQAKISTLRSEAKVDFAEGNAPRVKINMGFTVEKPGRLRAEVDSPLGGQTLATLASDGLEFQLFDSRAWRFSRGLATGCNLARLLHVGLRPEDVVLVLTGGAPLGEPISVSWNPANGGREVLLMRNSAGEEIIVQFDARENVWDVVDIEMKSNNGYVAWRAHNENFNKYNEIRLPDMTWIEDPIRHANARLRFRSREPNVALAPNLFHLEPPAGMATTDISWCE